MTRLKPPTLRRVVLFGMTLLPVIATGGGLVYGAFFIDATAVERVFFALLAGTVLWSTVRFARMSWLIQ